MIQAFAKAGAAGWIALLLVGMLNHVHPLAHFWDLWAITAISLLLLTLT